jgi:sulfatase maturation enzyme AslB (radical SAM superfamily)
VDDDLIGLARQYNITIGSSLEGSVEDLKRLRPFADGRDASERILGGIRRLKEEGLLGGVVSVFGKGMHSEPADLLSLLDSVGASSLKLNLCAQLGRGNRFADETMETLREYAEFMKRLVEMGFSRSSPIREGNTANIADRILGRIPGYRCLNSPCDAGYTFQNVRTNGDIYACDRYSRFAGMRLGNVGSFMGSAGGVGNGGVNIEERIGSLIPPNSIPYKLGRRSVSSIDMCSKCPLRPYCGGGCAMESLCRFGSFDKPSAQCEFLRQYIPQVFEWLIDSVEFRAAYYPGGCERHSYQLNEPNLCLAPARQVPAGAEASRAPTN